jgi:transposase
MIKIDFSGADTVCLRELSINHPHQTIRLRGMALLLKSTGMPHQQIESTLDICGNTLRSWLKLFKNSGAVGLTEVHFKGPESALLPFEVLIRRYVEKTPPASLKKAVFDIEKITGIKMSKEQVRRYFKSLGIECRKIGTVPAKVNIAAQEEFKSNELEPRLEQAKQGKREVYFVDAAHFVLAAFLGYLWSFNRIFVKSPSGRQRFNVLGALNAITKELTLVTNNSYITSTEVCELLQNIKLKAVLPVTIVLDNARYQRCALVMGMAQQLGIELLFLPTYSPNLNLIERVWKFTKKECLNSRYYADFKSFRHAINEFLENMHTTRSEELKSLLTLKFQTFNQDQIKLAA